MADDGDADDLGLPGFEQETNAAAQARLARLQSACNGSMKPEARFSHLTDAGGGPMQYDLTLDTQAAPGDAQIATPLTEPRLRWTAPKPLNDGLAQSALEQQAVQALVQQAVRTTACAAPSAQAAQVAVGVTAAIPQMQLPVPPTVWQPLPQRPVLLQQLHAQQQPHAQRCAPVNVPMAHAAQAAVVVTAATPQMQLPVPRTVWEPLLPFPMLPQQLHAPQQPHAQPLEPAA